MPPSPNAEFALGLARAYAGALIFGLPMYMTAEMWELGAHLPAWKLALLPLLFFPFLVSLSWHAGFEPTFSWRDDVVDALVAFGVGITASAGMLWLLKAIDGDSSLREVVGMVTLQSVPASIGALLAQSQLGEQPAGQGLRGGIERWSSEVFIMAVGALFLSFNMAPTEEMTSIAERVGPLQALAIMGVSLALMHAFVYGVAFRGGARGHGREPGWQLFLRFTVVGYVVALLLSAFMLWIFGTLAQTSVAAAVQTVAVLGLPAALGAAAARLIL
jgi:putative integral membrane protein (TIGR02587 family)